MNRSLKAPSSRLMQHWQDRLVHGRFVILMHDAPFLHWDFLLEAGERALTWRLLERPVTGHLIPAEQIDDHRLHYLSYEGPVSGNRGNVLRVHAGYFQRQETQPALVRLQLLDCPWACQAEWRLTGKNDPNSQLRRAGELSDGDSPVLPPVDAAHDQGLSEWWSFHESN